MRDGKISVLLCEDMNEFSKPFFDHQKEYFHMIPLCEDVDKLPSYLRQLDSEHNLPDVLLLDLFCKREKIIYNEEFLKNRQHVDNDINVICDMIRSIGQKAREMLSPKGIRCLEIIRQDFPEYTLPVLLYSRLGPYILLPEEADVVDKYNSEFLLKWLDHDEQRRKIELFFRKWRSQDQPLPLELSRKLSTLPPVLANEVCKLLKEGQFKEAIRSGYFKLEEFLQDKFGSTKEGEPLSLHMRTELINNGRRRRGERRHEFENRVNAVSGLYYNIYILIRCSSVHFNECRRKHKSWQEVDTFLSIYNFLWREVEELIR